MQNWKTTFYARYPSMNAQEVTAESYSSYGPYGKHIIQKCFPADKAIRILDMGCGFGGFLHVCQRAGYTDATGYDLSAENVMLAHAYGMKQVHQGEIFETLKGIEAGTFDIVLFLDVIEHFDRSEVLTIFQETYRILKKGGQLIVHVPNAEGLFGSRIRYADFTHEQAFTPHSFAQICRFSGFGSIQTFEDKPLIHSLLSFFRNVIWQVGTFPFRLLHAAETGNFSIKLSQNILCRAVK